MAPSEDLPTFALGKEIGVLSGRVESLLGELRIDRGITNDLQKKLDDHAEWDNTRLTKITEQLNENARQLVKIVAIGGTLLAVLEIALQIIFRR